MNDKWQVYVEQVENGYVVVAEKGCGRELKEFVARDEFELYEVMGGEVADLFVNQFSEKASTSVPPPNCIGDTGC